MSTIPVSVTEKQFMAYIRPVLSTARRGYECSIPLYKVFNYLLYRLHTGCQWERLPIERDPVTANAEISWQAVYYHFRKWSRDGSLTKVWQQSVRLIRPELDLHHLNLDGSHTLAKKGGETVAYQGRKKAKTSNILPITDGHGFVLVSSGLVAGNHHDAFDLKHNLQAAFKTLKRLKLLQPGAYFNADAAFDTRDARTTCFNYGLHPNIPENKRNRKTAKPGPKRQFNAVVYKQRFTSERSFAWMDKFRALLIRFDRSETYFLAAHHLAFALINLRHIFQLKA